MIEKIESPYNTVIGIDYSISCPAITVVPVVNKEMRFEDCQFHFLFADERITTESIAPNVHGYAHKEWKTQQERHDNISDWALSIVNKTSFPIIGIEGYSMASRGRVFNIAENAGLLKHKLWSYKYDFIEIAPTTVKKHFAGTGRADKTLMYDAFVAKTKIRFVDLISSRTCAKKIKHDSNPISDMVDSYAICNYVMQTVINKSTYTP